MAAKKPKAPPRGKKPKKPRKSSGGKKPNAWRAYAGGSGSSNAPIPW
jgi:hypothetical protein